MVICRIGLTKLEVAKALHLFKVGLYHKMNNITEFKASEIVILYKLLHLKSLEEQQQIFLAGRLKINKTEGERMEQAIMGRIEQLTTPPPHYGSLNEVDNFADNKKADCG